MTSSQLFQQAMTAVKNGQRTRARNILLKLVEQNPDHEMAWLWLSDLVDDLEDRIIALENALTINPERPRVKRQLARLRRRQTEPAPVTAPTTRQARSLIAQERSAAAHALLLDILRRRPDDVDAWWLLSQLVYGISEQMVLLETVLRLDPSHSEAQKRLTQLQLAYDDSLGLGQAYEAQGDLARAKRAYKFAVKLSNSPADVTIAQKRLGAVKRHGRIPTDARKRHTLRLHALADAYPVNNDLARGRRHEEAGEWNRAIAAYRTAVTYAATITDRTITQQRLDAAIAQRELSPVRLATPTQTALRLAVGPLILYLLLLFLHSGLNPRYTPPLLCLLTPLTAVGGLLIAGAVNTPFHPAWLRLPGRGNLSERRRQLAAVGAGLICLLLPFFFFLLNAWQRLEQG